MSNCIAKSFLTWESGVRLKGMYDGQGVFPSDRLWYLDNDPCFSQSWFRGHLGYFHSLKAFH